MRKEIEYVDGYDIPESSFMPFGGLLKPTIYNQVLMEIVADPFRTYKPGQMVERTHSDRSKVGKALKDLESLGLLRNISHAKRRPEYEPCLQSKRLLALTLLSYAVVDDRIGEDGMDRAILSYLNGTVHDESNVEAQREGEHVQARKSKGMANLKV